ncbi:MAG: carbamoyl phosphate synthase small subunit [Eubacteriales bacterium]
MEKTMYLTLADGHIFRGIPFGAEAEVTAEIVFTTGMAGYLETLTDRSYYGQTVVQTFPLIGNYGVIEDDFENRDIGPSAYIVKDWCRNPSNFRSQRTIHELLQERGIPGLCGIDTRTLTKIIREKGTMNGRISYSAASDDLDQINAYKIVNAVHNVSCDKMYTVYSSEKKFHVALYDFGLKENILRELVKRGCDVTVCPYTTTAADLADMNINGVMLSNGPGDPADNPIVINNLSDLSKTGIPIFGICLGHQLLALAHGFSTGKLKYGHRGVNQPAKNLSDGRVYITSQNHGYAVLRDSINNDVASELFINVNDNTCEGIKYNNIPAFSVQFHPEASAGPHDTAFLFDEFIMMLEAKKNAVR